MTTCDPYVTGRGKATGGLAGRQLSAVVQVLFGCCEYIVPRGRHRQTGKKGGVRYGHRDIAVQKVCDIGLVKSKGARECLQECAWEYETRIGVGVMCGLPFK